MDYFEVQYKYRTTYTSGIVGSEEVQSSGCPKKHGGIAVAHMRRVVRGVSIIVGATLLNSGAKTVHYDALKTFQSNIITLLKH